MEIYHNRKDYISVREFARRVNMSPQAIYKQLDNKLLEYCETWAGKKVVSIKALELFNGTGTKNSDKHFDNQVVNELSKVVDELTTVVNNLSKQVDFYKLQIEEKDKQIATLQTLLNQSQQLNAQAQNKIMMLEAPKKHWWQRKPNNEVIIHAETSAN